MRQEFEIAFRTRTSAFVDEIGDLVRRSVLEAVQSALGTAALAVEAPPRRPETHTADDAPARPRRKRRVDPVRRDAQAIAGPLVELLRAEGGLRFGEITSRTRMAAAKLGPLVERLVADGRIAVVEHRDGARYVAT